MIYLLSSSPISSRFFPLCFDRNLSHCIPICLLLLFLFLLLLFFLFLLLLFPIASGDALHGEWRGDGGVDVGWDRSAGERDGGGDELRRSLVGSRQLSST